MFFIAEYEKHFTKTIRIIAPTSLKAGKLRYRDTTEISCDVTSLVAEPTVFTTPFQCCSRCGVLTSAEKAPCPEWSSDYLSQWGGQG